MIELIEPTMALSSLIPISLMRDADRVTIALHASSAVFELNAKHPVEVIAGVDPTTVEPVDPTMMTVRQFDEDGTPQTICLTPLQAIQLAQAIDSYLFFPMGVPSDGLSDNDNTRPTPALNGRLV